MTAESSVTYLQCNDCDYQFARTDKMTPADIHRISVAHGNLAHEGRDVLLGICEVHSSIEAMESNMDAPTPLLEDFIAAYFEDDNIWWRIGCGHHMNLFDAAVERIRELEQQVRELQDEDRPD